MKKATLFIWLCFAALGAHAQISTYNVTGDYTNEWEYIDLLSQGSDEKLKAIRVYSDEGGLDLYLIGKVNVTMDEVVNALQKAPCGMKLTRTKAYLRIEPNGMTLPELYQLVKALVVGDLTDLFAYAVRRT